MRCMIVDDEPLALDLLENYIKKSSFLELTGRYDDPVEALEAIKNEKPDLVFFDIQMPGLNGIELARFVPPTCMVIFVTAFQQYALDSYKVNAVDYLLKPVSYAEFLAGAEKALKRYELLNKAAQAEEGSNRKKQTAFIKTEYKLQQISFSEILYIEGLKDYVKIYLENEAHPLLSRMSMKAIEELVPSEDFIRVHRSFIVRKDKIRSIERNRILFGNTYIPISDSYKEEFQRFIEENN